MKIEERSPSPWRVEPSRPYHDEALNLWRIVDAHGTPVGLADSIDKPLLQFIAANVNIGSALYADVVEAK